MSASLSYSRPDNTGQLSTERGARRRTTATGPQSQDDRLSELVAAAVGSDPIATQQVLSTVWPFVLRYCRARIGRVDRSFVSADDVAQEVCLSLVLALPGYRDQGQPFLAFVYGIAQHKVADARRAAARDRSLPVSEVPDQLEPRPDPEQRALAAELTVVMAGLLAVLTEKQRQILVLRVVAGLSSEETADVVGSTPGAVRVAQHRALARLRKRLARTVTPRCGESRMSG